VLRSTEYRGVESPAGRSRIVVLDGFRALAILAVLFYHYTVRWAQQLDPHPHLPEGKMFAGVVPLAYGWFGVELFFVISGFVIFMTLENCSGVVDFLVRRFARIWPALLVAATLTAVVLDLAGPSDWKVGLYDYVSSLLLIDPSVTAAVTHHPGVKWVDGVYWSLFVEIRFYVLAALVFLLSRGGFSRAWFVLQLTVFGGSLFIHGDLPLRAFDLITFADYMPYFTFGIFGYQVYRHARRDRSTFVGLAASIGMALYYSTTGFGAFADKSPLICMIANALIFALFAFFLFDLRVVRIFAMAPVVSLGRASYSLYLLHQKCGIVLLRAFVGAGIPYLASMPIIVLLLVLAALGFHRLI